MIFVVIAVFNRKEFTRSCLKSLRAQTYKNFEVIVVDDNSTDGTAEMLKNEFSEVYYVKGDGNLWWAGATNAGVEYALQHLNAGENDHILTLNNDLEVPVDYLEKMSYYAFENQKCLLGSNSVNILDENQLNFCGVAWNEITGKYHSIAEDYQGSYALLLKKAKTVRSDVLPGRGTLIPVPVFHKIGFFDSINFPQYAADEDFSLRARRDGWNLIIPSDVYLKSHINETGVNIDKATFSIKFYKQIFFSIRSPLNLKIRYRWAMKNTKLKLVYFMLDCTRIVTPVVLKSFSNLFSGKRYIKVS